MTTIRDTTPRARKERQCEECGRKIERGEVYSSYFGTWEGEAFTNTACAHCAAARRILAELDDYYWESYYGGLTAALSEAWREHISIARLHVGTSQQWRFKSGLMMPIPQIEPGGER